MKITQQMVTVEFTQREFDLIRRILGKLCDNDMVRFGFNKAEQELHRDVYEGMRQKVEE